MFTKLTTLQVLTIQIESLMILTRFCHSDFARRIFRRHIEPVLAGQAAEKAR